MKKGVNMNREIKFRIIHNGKTYYWGYCEGGFAGIPTSSNGLNLEKAKELSCQYTNLKDKNGKEIYEGDIIKEPHPNMGLDMVQSVEWDNKSGSFLPFGYTEWHTFPHECEVVGNVYENPELLEPKP